MSKLDSIFHRAAYLKKKGPRGNAQVGETDKYGLDVIWEYESIDAENPNVAWYDWIIGTFCVICRWPFNGAVLFSFYCVFIILITFFSSFLVGYLLHPLYSFLSDDKLRTAVSFVGLLTSSPFLAFVFYVLCRVITNVVAGIRDLIVMSLSTLGDSGVTVARARATRTLCLHFWQSIGFLLLGAGSFYLTFFIDGCSIFVGCFVFVCAPLSIVLNFAPACLGGIVGLAGNTCGIPGWDLTNLIYRWISQKATGERSDDTVGDDLDDMKEEQEAFQSMSVFLKIVLGLDYFWIGNFADHVIRGELKHDCKRMVSMILIWVLTALNLFTIIADYIEYTKNPDSSFLIALILRIIFLPVFTFFHPLITWIHTAKSTLLSWVLRLSSIIPVVAMVAICTFAMILTPMLDDLRLTSLPPLSENYSRVPSFTTDLTICNSRFEDRSILELIALSFGGYDYQNPDVFVQELDYILGPNWNATITYSIHEPLKDIPFVVYTINDVTIFTMRGFNTPHEFALQAEIITRYYFLPLLLQLTPLYTTLKNQWIAGYGELAFFFGLHWFSPMSQFTRVIDAVLSEYNDRRLTEQSRVVFVGPNIGGVLAKVMGMITDHLAIGFISLPSVDEEFLYRYDFDEVSRTQIANVYVKGGLFGVNDKQIGTNFELAGISTGWTDSDSIYPSFCLLAETCGHHNQFGQFCEKVIGKEKLKTIEDFIASNREA